MAPALSAAAVAPGPPKGDAPPFEAEALTKYYGAIRGVEGVSLAVRRGEIFGFLGPNGAGKTTVIRLALGLLRPTSGQLKLFGRPVRAHSDADHGRIGYLPADLRLWRRLTVRRTSDLLLSLGGLGGATARRDELARRLELDLDRRIKSLSLGNRQKVGLVLALQHAPELLIMDEPTSGLDPLVRQTVTEILRDFASGGGTIIYSSHNLGEVEQICSRVGILRRGKLVALKTIDEIRTEREQSLEFVFASDSNMPEGLPDELAQFRLSRLAPRRWRVDFHGSPSPLLRWLADFDLAEISSPSVSLEQAFLGYYHDAPPVSAGPPSTQGHIVERP